MEGYLEMKGSLTMKGDSIWESNERLFSSEYQLEAMGVNALVDFATAGITATWGEPRKALKTRNIDRKEKIRCIPCFPWFRNQRDSADDPLDIHPRMVPEVHEHPQSMPRSLQVIVELGSVFVR